MMSRIRLTSALAVGATLSLTSAALAQQTPLPNARPVWENARGGALATRAPGRMVRQGSARFRAAHAATLNRARNGPTITAVEPTIDTETQLKVDLLDTIFQDLNAALLLLAQQIDGGDSDTSPEPEEPATDVSALLGTISGRETE